MLNDHAASTSNPAITRRMNKRPMKSGTYNRVNKFYLKTIVATSISCPQTKTSLTLFGLNNVNAHPAVIPTDTTKKITLSRILPVERSMTNRPKTNENNPPTNMVQGTTFLAKN